MRRETEVRPLARSAARKALASLIALCLGAPPAAAQQALEAAVAGPPAAIPANVGGALGALGAAVSPLLGSPTLRVGLQPIAGTLSLEIQPAATRPSGAIPAAAALGALSAQRTAAQENGPAAALGAVSAQRTAAQENGPAAALGALSAQRTAAQENGPAAALAPPRLSGVAAVGAAKAARRAPGSRVLSLARNVLTAVRALAGDARAGRERPALARLGADRAPAPGPSVGSAGVRDEAERDFRERAGLGDAAEAVPAADAIPETPRARSGSAPDPVPAEDAAPEGASPDAAAARGGRRGGGRRSGGSEAPPTEPKYPARDISFNGEALPSVAFRPDRPVEALIVSAVDAAKKSVVVAAYEFKSREILKALRRAKERGVSVRLVIDYDAAFPSKYDDSDYIPDRSMELQALLNEGFDVQILRGMWKFGIMHNKFMVLDGKLAEFGSYNYSWTSEDHHFENAKFTDDAKHVRAFLAYWDYLRGLSVPFDAARSHPWPKELPPPPADASPAVAHNGVRLPTWFFSPGGGGEEWIVKAIGAAEKSIDVSMFTFRSTRIARALLEAKARGVRVRLVLDRSQFEGNGTRIHGDWLAFHKIKVKTLAGPNPDGPEKMEKDHNKFMVIDGALVETGSFNWTKNAELMNFENGHFTTDAVDAQAYQEFFEELYRKAEAVEAPESEPTLPTDEQLVRELLKEPDPPPPPTVWPEMPEAPTLAFNGESFPAYAFRPMHPVRDLLVQAIDGSKESIRIAVYEFTLQEVFEALKRAKARGVRVQVVVDYSHMFPRGKDHAGQDRRRSPQIEGLIDDGFDVRILRGITATGINHNKFAVFDGKMLEFGSYNWADTAENDHFENVLFTTEAERVAFYDRLWQYLYANAASPEDAATHDWNAAKPGPAPKDSDWALELNGTRFPRSAASPNGGVEAILISAIHAAQATIDVAMFSFYSRAVAEALLSAKNRGVAVRLVFDKSQSKLMKLDQWFAYYGFDVKIVAGPDNHGNVMFEKMHNKFMLVDGKWLETGSYNYTPNAEQHNFENAGIFDAPAILAGFKAFFQMLYDRGWKAPKPDKPPELKADPADFFGASQVTNPTI